MKRLVLLALALSVVSLSGPRPAEARHHSCGSGRIYRVSMGICVGARSRLGREYAGARRTIRYGRHHRIRFALRSQQEEEEQAYERERRFRVKPPPAPMRHRIPRLAPQDLETQTPPVEEAAEVPYVIDMPFGIWGSRMMRPPGQPYWRLP